MADEPTEIIPAPRRHINLNAGERDELLQQEQIEHAVSLFLDLQEDRTWQQIADDLGLSLASLKRLTKTVEFGEVYDRTLVTLGHHPRMQALQTALPDLLPASFRAMDGLLKASRTPMAQLGAVKLLWETLDIKNQQQRDDPSAITNFLKNAGVNVEGDLVVNVNLPIPTEYQEAFKRMFGEVIEGDAVDVPE